MRRGQSAIEFVLLASAMLVGVTLTIVIAHNMLAQVQKESQEAALTAIENAIKRELDHAYTTPSGYNRVFTLPYTVEETPYSVFVLEEIPPLSDAIIITWKDKTRLKFLPYNINGTIGPGTNRIAKISTGLMLNNSNS